MNALAKEEIVESSPRKVEMIRVDFRPKKEKKMIILWDEGDEEIRPLNKQPSIAEMMAIVGGYPQACSVIFEGKTRTMIINGHGCIKPYRLNARATDLRPMALIDTTAQVWGPAILLFGFRVRRL